MFKHVSHVTLQRSKNPSAPHPPPPTTTTYFARRPYSPPPRPSNFPTFLGHAPSVKGPIHGVNAAVSADRALRQDVWLIPCSAKANKSPKYDYRGAGGTDFLSSFSASRPRRRPLRTNVPYLFPHVCRQSPVTTRTSAHTRRNLLTFATRHQYISTDVQVRKKLAKATANSLALSPGALK